MKYGIREICEVVLKAKATQQVGNKTFFKNEPVIYFDTLKTSSLEGAATTVYAQGGRGNARLIAWEGERTITFTMEDALISPAGFMILSGAGLIEPNDEKSICVHATEQTAKVKVEGDSVSITLDYVPAVYEEGNVAGMVEDEDYIYVMPLDSNGQVYTEPFIATGSKGSKVITVKTGEVNGRQYTAADIAEFKSGAVVLVDYYREMESDVQQIDITPDKFGGNYYLEASTLFRDTNGVDVPAEFIVPNCKIQSNFTFTMASSGDPSTFTFTMDAFPDYTRFDKTKKVLAALQILAAGEGAADKRRSATKEGASADEEQGEEP